MGFPRSLDANSAVAFLDRKFSDIPNHSHNLRTPLAIFDDGMSAPSVLAGIRLLYVGYSWVTLSLIILYAYVNKNSWNG